jgi:hypothetical protein
MTAAWFASGEFAQALDERIRTAHRDRRLALNLEDHDGVDLADAVLDDLHRLSRESGLGD